MKKLITAAVNDLYFVAVTEEWDKSLLVLRNMTGAVPSLVAAKYICNLDHGNSAHALRGVVEVARRSMRAYVCGMAWCHGLGRRVELCISDAYA